MTEHTESSGELPDDMAEYLQEFLDETEEQLDDLVETMLALERDSTKPEGLNEAFRLIHSIKGSAGMMGFSSITALTHQLESRFERFRSGLAKLDPPTMNVVLHSIDYLRQCTNRLREGQRLGSPADLLEELRQLEERAASAEADQRHPAVTAPQAAPTAASPFTETRLDHEAPQDHQATQDQQDSSDTLIRLRIRFRGGLQLTDLKAQLIVARLSGLGDVRSTRPDLDQLSDADHLEEFDVQLETHEDAARLREAADVEGVESIEFAAPIPEIVADVAVADPTDQDAATDQDDVSQDDKAAETITRHNDSITMRVDIERLDSLMNLAGELVVTRARFVEVSRRISPALRKASMLNRIRDFRDNLRHTIEGMESLDEANGEWSARIRQLRVGLELMDEQSEICDNGRQCFGQIIEAIDQLSRVSDSLQRGVLETRMVPVGPLFNRFKRVVRDLSMDRGKQVTLRIRGEKTELDKRMIDELGDPLVHLVRNSIDHGLEPPDVRRGRGKPEAGTIYLEASQSGNSVYVHVRDDGGGIDVAKIKTKLTEKRILGDSAVAELSDEQALEYIWHPGFSTAQVVTDVSGRGVGMDAVKTRIHQLNGTIEVDSSPSRGTSFMIRLPLTLAIINSLLVRLRDVVFSMPIDDVREIVSVDRRNVLTVHQKQTFDVRGEFLPLVSMDDIFHWHGIDYGYRRPTRKQPTDSTSSGNSVEVVILRAAGKSLGLRVDELLGRQDVVIKSLAENFINIRGLSGASILGDGRVCLMLDVGKVIELATRRSRTLGSEG